VVRIRAGDEPLSQGPGASVNPIVRNNGMSLEETQRRRLPGLARSMARQATRSTVNHMPSTFAGVY
jgi:hypothetical protein